MSNIDWDLEAELFKVYGEAVDDIDLKLVKTEADVGKYYTIAKCNECGLNLLILRSEYKENEKYVCCDC